MTTRGAFGYDVSADHISYTLPSGILPLGISISVVTRLTLVMDKVTASKVLVVYQLVTKTVQQHNKLK